MDCQLQVFCIFPFTFPNLPINDDTISHHQHTPNYIKYIEFHYFLSVIVNTDSTLFTEMIDVDWL